MRRAFYNGTILDGTKDMRPISGRILLTENDKISEILSEPNSLQELSAKGYEMIDLEGGYIMPGLINMHVHLAGNGKVHKKPRDNTKLVKMIFSNPVSSAAARFLVRKFAEIELNSGVTTVRTVGGLKDLDSKLRDEINSGKVRGPRILAANEGISVPGGHMAGSVAVVASSIDDAVRHVHHCKEVGTDLVKLMVTGGVLDAKEKGTPGEMKMRSEMIKAVCDEAHKLGMRVAAHVESTEGMVVSLKNGVDSIEHGAKPTEEVIRLFKERGAFLVTTLSPALPFAYFDRSVSYASEIEQFNGNLVFEGIRDCAIAALENDIPIALGNDVGCPWITQYDFWRELQFFHKFTGVSRSFALHTATLKNAELAGIGDITGSIELGKCADMIIAKENPLEDLCALRNVSMVVARGELIKNLKVKRNAKIDYMLDQYC